MQANFILKAQILLLDGELWRLLTHNLMFTTPGELLFGTVLLYFFRLFERQMGSSKFFALWFTSTLIYTSALSGIDTFLPPLYTPAPGPYAILFACLARFFLETPKIYEFQLLGSLALSDKSFPYLLSLQLLLSAIPNSLSSFALACFVGLLLQMPFIQPHVDTPLVLVSLGTRFLLPLLNTRQRASSTSRTRRSTRSAGNSGERAQNTMTRPERTSPDPHPVQAPPENAVSVLTGMGFSREQAVQALQQSRNDVQAATERLLGA